MFFFRKLKIIFASGLTYSLHLKDFKYSYSGLGRPCMQFWQHVVHVKTRVLPKMPEADLNSGRSWRAPRFLFSFSIVPLTFLQFGSFLKFILFYIKVVYNLPIHSFFKNLIFLQQVLKFFLEYILNLVISLQE